MSNNDRHTGENILLGVLIAGNAIALMIGGWFEVGGAEVVSQWLDSAMDCFFLNICTE